MSDEKRLPTGGSQLQVLVRGGTTSSRHDKQRAERRVTAEAGRDLTDRQKLAVRQGDRLTKEGFVSSRLHSLRMMDSGNPQLVFYYLNRDGTVRQHCVGEHFRAGTDEGIILVCPRCLERGESHGDSQMKIMKSHHKFTLDLRKLGTLVQLLDPDGLPFHVRLAGTVTVDDVVKCDSCGLYKVTIIDSKVSEA
jgi:hypothetical protein